MPTSLKRSPPLSLVVSRIPLTLRIPGQPDQVVQAAIDAFGGPDIVVNNAGYIWHSAIHNMSDEQWNAMIDIHATAQFRVLRAYGRWLRGNRGPDSSTRKVVNISSTMGVHGGATQLAYSAGKAAVVGMTKTLAKEWGRFNVTGVNAVAFGAIETGSPVPMSGKTEYIHCEGSTAQGRFES